jgi:hypothetical protein
MLRHGEINPLNVHGLRELEHCPPHFTQVIFDLVTGEKEIVDWIYNNLSSRFYVGPLDIPQDANGPIVRKTLVAFEIPSEASYFALFLPEINQLRWSL